ncbi:hypothetical protein Pla52n_17280 [Stieleria varia]|uniref:Uncharacterized protein n=1 Tax=Stieleria varia TaxID=2528005 RepID=A0A5C6B3H6_9BACT|nr:hypothetical protein Pla52n_17280 [Stieleria varia]
MKKESLGSGRMVCVWAYDGSRFGLGEWNENRRSTFQVDSVPCRTYANSERLLAQTALSLTFA